MWPAGTASQGALVRFTVRSGAQTGQDGGASAGADLATLAPPDPGTVGAECTTATDCTDTEQCLFGASSWAACTAVAPKNITLETIPELKRFAKPVYMQTVQNRAMPIGNQTGMTDEERDTLGRWVNGLK